MKELIKVLDKSRPLIVLAPHPDDEVIGCHTLLRIWPGEKSVWFFSEEDRLSGPMGFCEYEGKDRAELLAKAYELDEYEWLSLGDDLTRRIKDVLPANPVFAVPNTLDHHPWHREVTRQFHRNTTPTQDVIYYSVSKNTPTLMLVSEVEVEIKKSILRDVYPREKLWEKDESFVLFENYQQTPGEQMVWVTTRFEGWHYWKAAPVEVAFLQSEHRHEFHVKVGVSVGHNDREVEFFILKDLVKDAVGILGTRLHQQSCEMIAHKIARHVANWYESVRRIEVTVSEDGENGATIRW